MTLRTGVEPMDGQPIGCVPIKPALTVLIYHIFDKRTEVSQDVANHSINATISHRKETLFKIPMWTGMNFNF